MTDLTNMMMKLNQYLLIIALEALAYLLAEFLLSQYIA